MTLVHRLLAARLELQPDRVGRLVLFLSIAILQFASMALARTASEALFLANLGAEALPTYLLLVGVIVVPAAGVMSRLIDRMPKAKLFRISLVLSLGVALVLRGLAATGTRSAWYAVLVGVVLIEVLLGIQYFVLITDYFTSLEQKRLIAAVTLATAAGSAVGGGLANLFVLLFATADLLLIYPAFFLILYPLIVRLEKTEQPFESPEADTKASMQDSLGSLPGLLREYPIIALMAIVGFLDVLLNAMGSVLTYNVYAQAFPNEQQMTQFLGLLKGATAVLQVVVITFVTEPLVQRLGVGRMNVIYPLTTFASLFGLAVRPVLPVAVGASVNWDALSPSLANPVENLTYNAVPPRFLGRVRSISEGMLQPVGLTVAGIMLAVLVDRISFTQIAWIAVGVSALHVVLAAYRGRKYVDALASQLSSSAMDLAADAGSAKLPPEYVEEIERLLVAAEPESSAFGFELAARYDADRFFPVAQPVLGNLAGRGRQAGVTYLSALHGQRERIEVRRLLAEGPPDVQALVLEAVLRIREEVAASELEPLLASPDARVRGLARAAALRLGGPATPLLVRDPDLGDDGLAAVARGARAAHDRRLVPVLVEAMVRGAPGTRATALDALSELSPLGAQYSSVVDLAAMELESESPRVRAGAYALVAREHPDEAARIALGLEDSHAQVRRSVVRALGRFGDTVIPHLAGALASPRPEVVHAAFEVLGALRSRAAAQAALTHLAADHERIQRNVGWLKQIPSGDERWLALTFALEASDRRAIDRVLNVLAAFGLGRILRHARQALRGRDPRLRANAVEALASIPERRFVIPVLDLLEALASGGETTLTGTRKTHLALEELLACDDPWVRVGAIETARALGRPLPAAVAEDPNPIVRDALESTGGESTMSRLLFLRQVALFQSLTLDELFALDGVLRRVDYLPGETIFEEGSVGDDFYVISDGEVAVCTGLGAEMVQRARLGKADFFGEMALFDDEPRSATCKAETACALLALDRGRFFSLIEQMPQLGLAICKTLTQRLRRTERDLRAANAAKAG